MRKLRPHSFGEKPRRSRWQHLAMFSLLALVFVVFTVVMMRAARADDGPRHPAPFAHAI